MSDNDKKIERDEKGIPLKSPMPNVPILPLYIAFNGVFGVIGYALAYYLSYQPNIDKANTQINIITQYELGWLYLGILVLKTLQIPIMATLGESRKVAKIGLPDQQVYKVMGSEGSKLGYVLMENDGPIGDFNRSQRALMNYHEVFPTTVLTYVAASFVFPYASFLWITLFAISRCIMASGYKSSVNGRMLGSMIGGFAQATLQGMLIIVSYKSLS